MSRTTYIILTALVLILGSAGLYLILGGKISVTENVFDGSPFGEAPSDSGDSRPGEGNTPAGEDTPDTTSSNPGALSYFFKIADKPVAGAVAFSKNGSTRIRYVDRATGHVDEVNPLTLERIQISNITEPRIYEALWKSDGSGFLARSVGKGSDTIENTSMILIPPKATSTSQTHTVQSTLLRGAIDTIAVNTDGSLIYSLDDSGVVAVAGFSGERPRTLFQTSFTNWRIEPATGATALIYTKASADAPGYAYTLSLASGALNKVLGPITALTALPSTDLKRVLYSGKEGNSNIFAALTVAPKTSVNLFPATLSEKCVWGRKSVSSVFCGAPKQGLGNIPIDSWYKGLAHYSDQIWKFDTNSGTAILLLDPEEKFDIAIDVYKPVLAPNEDYLFLINKNDLSLWALKLD